MHAVLWLKMHDAIHLKAEVNCLKYRANSYYYNMRGDQYNVAMTKKEEQEEEFCVQPNQTTWFNWLLWGILCGV